jgi:hypothetical protein
LSQFSDRTFYFISLTVTYVQRFALFDCPARCGAFLFMAARMFKRSGVMMGRTPSVGDSPSVRIELRAGEAGEALREETSAT